MQPKRSPKLSIAAAISIISVFGISIGLTVPVLALVLSETGHSSAAIGAHVSVQFLGLMLASSITPALLVRFGVSNLMMKMNTGEMDSEIVRKSIKLFADAVFPRF